ncbi:hypothetical protein [Planktothrix pseudagardhii]|uniref:Uncharacterized protein n=1 Tax=Planktothrix pseudagardhii TaxID=132604 RepID=A0A9W4GBG8_9CYAN|nr:hypothetical protein [Planktothrix pseudagardhii]CAD5988520.1 hypothetical protein NO713_05726 [Planktothrix pseudagardhii]
MSIEHSQLEFEDNYQDNNNTHLPELNWIEHQQIEWGNDSKVNNTNSTQFNSIYHQLIEPINNDKIDQLKLSYYWDLVRENLVEIWELPAELIDLVHQKGWINTDEQNCAVFTLRTLDGHNTGTSTLEPNGEFSIRLNLEDDLVKNQSSESGFFWIATQHNIERAIITSDPIETLSVLALDPDFNIRPTLYLSIDAISSLPTDFLRDIPTIVVGLKGDEFGEQLSQQIIEFLPQAQRINPGFYGWNQLLIDQNQDLENQRDKPDQVNNQVQQELQQWTEGINLN